MNKLFLSFLLITVLGITNVSAKEIPQGTVEISGDSSFSLSSTEFKPQGGTSEDSDSREISLTLLYYMSPNFGVGFFWENQYTETDDGADKFEDGFNILGPTIGYNLPIGPTSSFGLFAALVLVGDFESEFNGVTFSEGDISGFVFGGDFKNFLTDSVSINAGVSISTLEFEEDGGGEADVDSTDLDIGISVYF